MTTQEKPDQRALLQRAFVELKQLRAELDASQGEPIAVIGLGCRMPGGGEGPDEFWSLLHDGRDAVRDLPADRWDLAHFEATLRRIQPLGPTRVRGGFLERCSAFDPTFFGISPREAACMDPQQRLMLEVTWEALEDAGLPAESLSGSRTAVFAGVHSQSSDYFLMQVSDPSSLDAYSGTGTAHSVLAGRISYCFDLRGPSVAVDTACSASLVAAHLACASLRAKESELAIAGGVNLRLSPAFFLATSRMGTGSGSGACRVFDARADGVVTGEGCGVLILKRLSDALRDRDAIWALIRGSAVNQDGTSAGLTAPNVQAQEAVLREALRRAGVAPAEIGFVETHGTGTVLGDPMEVEALTRVLGAEGDARCALGAVKSNIGHLEGAAGVAGLIKAILALHHEVIPPNVNFETLNPHIRLDDTRFVIPTTPLPWPANGKPRFAGVSSFGWSGTNAHVVLQEAPAPARPAGQTARVPVDRKLERPPAYLLPLSAASESGLVARARQFAELLQADGALPLADLCFTAATRRTHHDHRLAAVGTSALELAQALNAHVAGESHARLRVACARDRRPKVVFVYPGQGSQWLGMARELAADEPSFREALERCERAFRPYVSWSLLEELSHPASARFEQIDFIQPCLFAIQVALTELWSRWGVRPDVVVGHSMGEVAAAHAAGALTLQDAARIICVRSRLLRRISGQGAMVLVDLGLDAAQRAISGLEHRISVAVSNSARSTVLSGDREALSDVVRALEQHEVFCRWIKVDVASHSPQVDPLRAELLAELSSVTPRSCELPMFSTVSAELAQGASLDAEYWVRNLRAPVLLASAVRRLLEEGHEVFVEVSPHPILLPAIEQGASECNSHARAVASLRREEPERETLLVAMGALYSLGVRPDWLALLAPVPGERQPLRLPTYPWQREDYSAFEASPPRIPAGETSSHAESEEHPLLGLRVEPATARDTVVWQSAIDATKLDIVRDHRVGGAFVLPAAAYIDMALAAGRRALAASELRLERVAFQRLLALDAGARMHLQCVVAVEGGGAASFRICSRRLGDGAQSGAWTEHVTGRIRTGAATREAPEALDRVRARLHDSLTPEQHYAFLAEHGVDYGPAFKGVRTLLRRDGEALAEAALPDAASDALVHAIHPALLDACFQALSAARSRDGVGASDTWVPVGFDRFELLKTPGRELFSHVTLVADEQRSDEVRCDIRLLNAAGERVAEVSGLRTRRLESAATAQRDVVSGWFYELAWQPQALQLSAPEQSAAGDWLVLLDRGGLGTQLAEQLESNGARVVRVELAASDASDNAAELRRVVQGRAFRGVVHLPSIDLGAALAPDAAPTRLQLGAMRSAVQLVQALVRNSAEPPRLWLVTAGAQPIATDSAPLALAQAPLWGLGRTVALEHPELACARIDLSAEPQRELSALCRELLESSPEDQVALRDERRYVARLARPAERPARAPASAGDAPFRVTLERPGTLEGLVCSAIERRSPAAGEVEIEVEAAGLNFVDVLVALGAIPDPSGPSEQKPIALGGECAGRIVALGAGVSELSLGDEVMAIAPAAFSTHVIASAQLVVRKPARLSLLEAAGVPIAFTTAYHALHRVARLAAGERVLIHAATGGVGLAAVALAQIIGAEVFASAGSEEKRAFLRERGVAHVVSSRSLDFADEVLAESRGEGVDVVLNSLSGPFIAASLALLRSYGRFVEIGKRDYYEDRSLGLRPFLRNLSFTLVDLLAVARERPALLREALSEVVGRLAEAQLAPLPTRVFPVERAADALHFMAQAKHIGKVVLSFAERRTTSLAAAKAGVRVCADGSYLVSGGLGGLGLTLAGWLVERGARSLVLLGRREPNAEQRASVEALRARGADVRTLMVDVANGAELERALSLVRRELPPLRAIFHCAVVLDDATLLEQGEERLSKVMTPKIDGAWNLHVATQQDPLDWFVLFSSGASLLGSPGQANYAAANAFLDALAHHRQRLGLPGLSINWGPWAEVGLAAASARRGERLAYRGLASITPEQGLEALERALDHGAAQLGVLPLNLRQWRQFYPKSAQLPIFAALPEQAEGAAVVEPAFEKTLRAAAPGARRGLLESHLIAQLSQVLRLARGRVERDTPFASLGLDSLMALELRNRIEASLGLTLPATLVWAHPSVALLAASLAGRLGLELAETTAPRTAPPERAEAARLEDAAALRGALESVANLSEQDALTALLNA